MAQAKYELTKFDAVVAAKSKSGPSVTEDRLNFQQQVTDYERALLEKERNLSEREKATARKRAAYEKLAPPLPKKDGDAPQADEKKE